MKITLTNRLSQVKQEVENEKGVSMTINEAYGFEDILVIDTHPYTFVEVDLDPHIKKSIVYTPECKIVYQLPVGPKAQAYHPDAFKGDAHTISVEPVSEARLKHRRNLALNGLDLRWETGYYPHASANVVTRDEPWFEAKNAIDGCLEREGHGAYPFQSWGGGLRDDLEFTLDFGREVTIDEVIIYLRADYHNDHDINWESAIIEFSNGNQFPIKMAKTELGQSYPFEPQTIKWLKLYHLKREISAAFSALTQIEVYGTEG